MKRGNFRSCVLLSCEVGAWAWSPSLGGEPKFTGQRVARRKDGGERAEPGAQRPAEGVRGRESRREDDEKSQRGREAGLAPGRSRTVTFQHLCLLIGLEGSRVTEGRAAKTVPRPDSPGEHLRTRR